MIQKLLTTSLVFILTDLVYLTSTKSHFQSLVKSIQNKPLQLNSISTFLTYISLIFGLYYFIIKNNKSISDAFILGLVIYTVYEFTNKAIFSNWTWNTVFIDSIWGGLLFSITTYLVYKIYGIK